MAIPPAISGVPVIPVISEYEVGGDCAGQRLDVFLAARTPGVSRAKIQKLIAAGAVAVDGRAARAKDPVAAGARIAVTWGPPPASALTPVPMALVILHEDDDLIVLDKPAGLTVHPGAGTGDKPTLVQGLLHHCGRLGSGSARDPTAWVRPGIVHRLDRDTSGVMVVAKTDRAHAALARQFHDKTTLRREYVALLDGALPEGAIVHESYLYRDPKERRRFASTARRAGVQPPAGARYAKSEFKREKLYGNRLTLAGVRLFTGRTHQIRVHACDLGMPVIGDQLYHHARQLPALFPPAVQAAVKALSRQLLHARLLTFRHPTTGVEVVAQSPPPPDFYNIIDMLLPFSNG